MTDKSVITNYKGEATEIACLGCARENGEIERVGTVLTTQHFDAHQDFEIPIPGFMIISSRRHLKSIDEFTPEEQQDFIETISRVRAGQRKALNIDTVYIFQNEDSQHHFHLWLFPRYPWMKKQFGQKIESIRPIMQFARENLKTTGNLAIVGSAISRLKAYFTDH